MISLLPRMDATSLLTMPLLPVAPLLPAATTLTRSLLEPYTAGLTTMTTTTMPRPGIAQIGAMRDPVERNRLITDTYHDLSQQMGQLLGPNAGANWATWASHASSRAGQTIRGEDLPVGNTLRNFGAAMTGPLGQMLNDQYETARGCVAEGNADVFRDIAPHYERFINTFRGAQRPDEAQWRRFASQFRPDQAAMRDGFRAYYDAMFERDPKRKQELTLLGNLNLALHEQRRLDPIINASLPSLPGRVVSQFMSLQLPDESLNLGSDLSPLNGQAFPPHLRDIQNPQLRQFLARWDRTPNTLQGSGVSNWASLDDRMNFICDLFRSRHLVPSLMR